MRAVHAQCQRPARVWFPATGLPQHTRKEVIHILGYAGAWMQLVQPEVTTGAKTSLCPAAHQRAEESFPCFLATGPRTLAGQPV